MLSYAVFSIHHHHHHHHHVVSFSQLGPYQNQTEATQTTKKNDQIHKHKQNETSYRFSKKLRIKIN